MLHRVKKLFTSFNPQAIATFTQKHYKLLATLFLLSSLITAFILIKRFRPSTPTFQNSSSPAYLFQAKNKLFQTHLGNQNNQPEVKFTVNNHSLTFQPVASSPGKLPPPRKQKRKLVFKNIYPHTDFVYQPLKNGLKEEIVLNKPTDKNTYLFQADFTNLTTKPITKDFSTPVFYDPQGNYLFHLEKPYAVDAAGKKTYNINLQIEKKPQADNPNLYFIRLTVDSAWLNSSNRQYPVRIDPTVVHDTSSEFATGQFNRLKDTGSGSSPQLETYYQELPADEHTVALWHFNEGTKDTCGASNQDICDASGNIHHGDFNDTADLFTSSSFMGDSALSLNGTDDFAYVDAYQDLDLQEMTMELWLYSNNFNQQMFVFEKGSVNTQYSMYFWNNDNFGFRTYSSGIQYDLNITTSDYFNNGKWNHLAATWDGSTKRVYVNGVLAGSSSFSGPIDNGAEFARIGTVVTTPQYYYNGKIDEFRISNIARTPEEIKAAASRRPYSVYTSDVIDLTNVTSWNSLSWTENGVLTGDGETLADSTSLVAQWNFNEISGTTANNAAGSCGASCDGTLTSFADTSGQDSTAGSGWTSDNARWPNSSPAALMFDGSGDYVSVPDDSSLDITSEITLAAWIYPTDFNESWPKIIVKPAGSSWSSPYFYYSLGAGDSDSFNAQFGINSNSNEIFDPQEMNSHEWHYVVGTYDGTTQRLYVDGELCNSSNLSGTISTSNEPLSIGSRSTTSNDENFPGTIDSVRIYSRALGADEILANYNSSNLQFQTRVGADTSPNDGSWDAWSPTSNETQIESFDQPSNSWPYKKQITITNNVASSLTNYQVIVPIDTATLIDAGKMNSDCSDARFTSSDGTTAIDFWLEEDCYSSSTKFWVEVPSIPSSSTADIYFHYGKPAATTASNLEDVFISGSIYHFTGGCSDANCAYIDNHTEADNIRQSKTVSSTSTPTTLNDTSGGDNFFRRYRFLFKPKYSGKYGIASSSDDGSEIAIFPQDGYGGGYNTTHPYGAHDVVATWYGGHGTGTCGESGSPGFAYFNEGRAYWIDYIMAEASGGQGAIMCVQTPNGSFQTLSASNFPGQIYRRQYTSGSEPSAGTPGSETASSYTETLNSMLKGNRGLIGSLSSDSNINQEGNESNIIKTRPTVDTNTVALYHLDETNGDLAGDDVFDATSNNNDGEFSTSNIATTVVNGISGKARGFDTDYITVSSPTNIPTGNSAFTTSFWFKDSGSNNGDGFIYWGDTSSNSANGQEIRNDGWQHYFWSNDLNCENIGLEDGNWHHLAVTYDPSANQRKMYMDGKLECSDSPGSVSVSQSNITIGKGGGSGELNSAKLDEVRISNIARTAEEIAEAYRAGRDHYLNRTISSTDLSSKTSLPFYIAADRPGTYLDITAGESAYANYQPDANTVGLWHLDEGANDACNVGSDDVCDASGNGNHGDISSAPAIVQGKIGKARDFDGSNDYIDMGDVLDIGTNDFTISAWVDPESLDGKDHFVDKGTWDVNPDEGYLFYVRASANSDINFTIYDESGTNFGVDSTDNVIQANEWHHIVASGDRDGYLRLYVNGQEVGSTDISSYSSQNVSSSQNFNIGRHPSPSDPDYFGGKIDEVVFETTARTASEIRQAYEIGRRTHPITIDFAASLDSGNLITGSGDTSFTVNATAYGLEQKGDALYLSDKIIVRENYAGTEYIAQGTVTAVTPSTGAVTVTSWDTGSTFPTSGYTANASVFKWQREYWDVTGALDSHLDAVTNLSLRFTNGNEGRTVWLDDLKSAGNYLTTPAGSTITSSTGNRYFQYRAILTSSDEAVSADFDSVTLDYSDNSTPNTPTLDSPTDTATSQSTTPALKTTATDDNSDYIRYKIELCKNEAMTTNCQTFDQTSSQTGWSGQNTQSSTAYTSGTQATYTVQSSLDLNTTYYWRSYAIDPAGTNTWSSTQGTPYSFTTVDLNKPSPCTLEETADDSSITINWSDTNTTEDNYVIERSVNGGAFSSLTTKAANSTSHQDSTISQGNTYQYRIAAYKNTDYSPWCHAPLDPLSIQQGNFKFEGLKMEGLKID